MSAELNNLDRILKDRLSGLQAEQGAPDWDRMSRALDESSAGWSSQAEELFDETIKSHIPLAAGTVAGWDRLEKSLDELAQNSSDTFDEIVSDKISNGHLSGPSSWHKLDHLLDQYEIWRRKVITSRVLEATVIFLLLFLFFQQNGSVHKSDKKTLTKQSTSVNPSSQSDNGSAQDQSLGALDIATPSDNNSATAKPNETDGQNASSRSNTYERTVIAQSPEPASAASRATMSSDLTDGMHSTELTIQNTLERKASNTQPGATEKGRTSYAETTVTETLNEQKPRVAHSGNIDLNASPSNNTGVSSANESEKIVSEELPTTDRIDLLSRLPLIIAQVHHMPIRLEKEVVQIIPVKTEKSKLGWSYAYHLDFDIANITSETDLDLGINRYRRFKTGKGIGFRVHRDMGKIHLESGVSAHYLSYAPRSVFFVQSGNYDDNYRGVGITAIKMYTVHIPLEFQYDALENEKFRIYGILGSNAHLNIKSSYDVKEVEIIRPTPQETGLMVRALEPVTLDQTPSEIREQEFESGGSSGSSLFESSYFTLNLGAGLDYYISDRVALFTTYTYRHRFNAQDFGPYRDRIRTGTISSGVRVRLIAD